MTEQKNGGREREWRIGVARQHRVEPRPDGREIASPNRPLQTCLLTHNYIALAWSVHCLPYRPQLCLCRTFNKRWFAGSQRSANNICFFFLTMANLISAAITHLRSTFFPGTRVQIVVCLDSNHSHLLSVESVRPFCFTYYYLGP